MIKEYSLDTEDEKIIDELDNLCGVVQNKEILKDMIIYSKLKSKGEVTFGNYNIIVRNDSSYNLLNDLLKVCSKVFLKYGIIANDRICYLDKMVNNRRDCPLDRIAGIEDSIIVINERKMRLNYLDEFDNLENMIKRYKDKVFVFEDTSYCEGETDAEIGELASWRMTIEKISLEDKIMYCKNMLELNNLKYKKQDIKEFADQPFWMLKNKIIQLIVESKSKEISFITQDMLKKKKEKSSSKTTKRKVFKNEKDKKTAKQELDELIGLSDIKEQTQKILNYVKLNKQRGKMPSLHMCFNGNPGTGKTSIARIIGKLFEEENILPGNGEFVEIHGRDLVAKYVGWTAPKVHETVERALGGVLFIDEAYSLVSDRTGGFEDEAIATLIKEMEDHRDEICIILAGYTNEMRNLISQNPGFDSRIQFTIDFPDYSEDELFEIFNGLCKKDNYKLTSNCKEILINNFKYAKKEETFGNGRYVRNLFEKIKFEQADRIIKTDNKNINTITTQDVNNAIINMKSSNKEKKKVIGFTM